MNDIEYQLYGAFARLDAKKKSKRGGARPNTGPKTGPGGTKVTRNTCLTADVWTFYGRNGQTASAEIEESTRKSKAFKSWMAGRSTADGSKE